MYRDKIIKCLNNYDIPSKLIKLIAKTLQDTKVRVNQNYTEKFEILTGVKQGDPLSVALFSIVIDDILKQLQLRGNISTRLKQCSAYADDILTLRLLMSYIYGAPSKARNANFVYIWTYVWQR